MKIYSWISGSTYALFYVFGPEKLGGRGDINTKILAEIERTGCPFDEAANKARPRPSRVLYVEPALIHLSRNIGYFRAQG